MFHVHSFEAKIQLFEWMQSYWSNPIPKNSAEPDASESFKDKSEKQLILSIFQADDMGHYVWMVFERVLFDVMTWLSMGGCVEVWLDSQREASVKHMKWKKTFEIQLQ